MRIDRQESSSSSSSSSEDEEELNLFKQTPVATPQQKQQQQPPPPPSNQPRRGLLHKINKQQTPTANNPPPSSSQASTSSVRHQHQRARKSVSGMTAASAVAISAAAAAADTAMPSDVESDDDSDSESEASEESEDAENEEEEEATTFIHSLLPAEQQHNIAQTHQQLSQQSAIVRKQQSAIARKQQQSSVIARKQQQHLVARTSTAAPPPSSVSRKRPAEDDEKHVEKAAAVPPPPQKRPRHQSKSFLAFIGKTRVVQSQSSQTNTMRLYIPQSCFRRLVCKFLTEEEIRMKKNSPFYKEQNFRFGMDALFLFQSMMETVMIDALVDVSILVHHAGRATMTCADWNQAKQICTWSSLFDIHPSNRMDVMWYGNPVSKKKGGGGILNIPEAVLVRMARTCGIERIGHKNNVLAEFAKDVLSGFLFPFLKHWKTVVQHCHKKTLKTRSFHFAFDSFMNNHQYRPSNVGMYGVTGQVLYKYDQTTKQLTKIPMPLNIEQKIRKYQDQEKKK